MLKPFPKYRAYVPNEGRIFDIRVMNWVKDDLFVGEYQYEYIIGPDAVLIEFTGYQDKFGRDIYSGDLVKIESDDPEEADVTFRVTWNEFDDCCISGETWGIEPRIFNPTVANYHEYMMIVGNVYE